MAKILLVDDSMFIRMSLKKVLEEAGHQIVGMGGSGKEAISLYDRLKPDLVTLDIVMDNYEDAGVLDGLVALEKIMSEDPAAVVLMVTSLSDAAVKDKAVKLGAAGFILKPFKAEEVKAAIEQAVAKKKDGEA